MPFYIYLLVSLLFTSHFVHAKFMTNTGVKTITDIRCIPSKKIDLNQLFLTKEIIRKFNRKNDYVLNGRKFIQDNRPDYYKVYFTQCLMTHIDMKTWVNLTDKELHRFFSLIYDVNFYFPVIQLQKTMLEIIEQVKYKNKFVDNLVVKLHQAYVRSNNILSARELEVEYPHISFNKTLPLNNSFTNERSVILLNGKDKEMTRVPFSFPDEGYVIVLASTACSPSTRFMNWFNDSANAKIKTIFNQSASFVTPTAGNLYIDETILLNDKLSPSRINYIYSRNEWPEIGLWDTPIFYFYYNGELRSQMVGWKSKDDSQILYEHLKGIKLLSSTY